MTEPVLIAGAPRSGTTWVGRVLEQTEGVVFVGEPDSEHKEPYALHAKRGLGTFPVLAPGDAAPDYERLWTLALDGHVRSRRLDQRIAARLVRGADLVDVHRSIAVAGARVTSRLDVVRRLARPPDVDPVGRRPVVKSVFVGLCLDWLLDRFPRTTTLVVERDPRNVIASWVDLGYIPYSFQDDPRLTELVLEPLGLPSLAAAATPVEALAWQVAVLQAVLSDVAARRPEIRVVRHEELVQDPAAAYKALTDDLGLVWTDRTQDFLEQSNEPGTAYEPKRNLAEQQQPDRWKKRLTSKQVDEITGVLSGFPTSVV